MQLLNIFLFWLFFGFLCAYLARRQGKSPSIWFAIGVFLGGLGVFLFFLMSLLEKRMKRHAPLPLPSKMPLMIQEEFIWFYIDQNRQPQGPCSPTEIRKLRQEQSISPASYVWKEGMSEWKKISDLSPLFDV